MDQDMIDITSDLEVEIAIRDDGEVVWVNVDGICRLRVYKTVQSKLVIRDDRIQRDPNS